MATTEWIDSASLPPRRPVGGSNLTMVSALLSMPRKHGMTLAEILADEQLERRDAGVGAADLVLDHPCDLDPERGVTECGHADHDRDAEAVGELLDALGLTEHLRTAAPKPTSKRCTGCQEVKDLEEFPRRSNASDRRISRCRKCRNEHNRAYRIAEKEAGQ
jgi:hypothetical protein